MPAPTGNDFAKKLKTKEIKDKVYQSYCDHLAKGKTQRSWYYEDEEVTLTSQTLETYIETDEDFNPIKKEVAKAKGLTIWEEHCENGALGVNKEVNTPMMQMIMRNKFGWDKEKEQKEEKKEDTILTRECDCDNCTCVTENN